jgi:hypothetical protein
MDYSYGDDPAPYDQNDWELLYLPTFEIDAEVIEGPNYADLVNFEEKQAAIVSKEKNLTNEKWEYDEDITMKFTDSASNNNAIYTGDCEWFILVKTKNERLPSDRDVRVYVKPKVEPVYSTWSLCYEGKLNQNNEIEMYSQQSLIEAVISIISQES